MINQDHRDQYQQHFAAKTVLALLLLFSLTFTSLSWAYSYRDIPENVRKWLYYEQIVNDRDVNSGTFSPLNFDELPPEYDPFNRTVFEIGYLEIPVSDLFIRYSKLSRNLKKASLFQREGKPFARFFIHPDMERLYDNEIKKYNYVKGEYLATPTSSPRSLAVWEKKNPKHFFGQKVSIYRSIGELIRINPLDKLERAFAINLAIQEISPAIKKLLHFDVVPEPLVVSTPARQYGNIARELSSVEDYQNGVAQLKPAFSIYSKGLRSVEPLLFEEIRSSGLPVSEAIEHKLGSVLAVHAYFMFYEGLVGEPHAQNVLLGFDQHDRMNGYKEFRDLDAFKPDLEMRALRNRSLTPFLLSQRPYKLLKLNKSKSYYDSSYNDYFRDAWGYAIEQALAKSVGISGGRKAAREHQVVAVFDRLILVEATRYLGSQIVLSSAKNFVSRNRARLEMLYPHVDWGEPNLTPVEMNSLLKEYSVYEVFQNEGERKLNFKYSETPFSLNQMVEDFKKSQRKVVLRKADEVDMKLLKKEYARLKFNYRTSTQVDPPEDAQYISQPGAILVYTKSGSYWGAGLLEPYEVVSDGSKFYAGVAYPRKEPNLDILKKLSRGFSSAKEAKLLQNCKELLRR